MLRLHKHLKHSLILRFGTRKGKLVICNREGSRLQTYILFSCASLRLCGKNWKRLDLVMKNT